MKIVTLAPNDEELAAAPILEGWVIEYPKDSRPWLYAWFFGHPEISDGEHGHTGSIVALDGTVPPLWVQTDGRLFRLGIWYSPAEREIRYWAQKLRRRQSLPLGGAPGGGNDIDQLISFIRDGKIVGAGKLDRMEQAYRDESQRS